MLNGDFVIKCSFLYALHPENINKEILSVIGSPHIFVDKKQLKQKLTSVLQNWSFKYEAFIKTPDNKQDQSTSTATATIEPGFINKLCEMYKYRRILRDLKQHIEHKDGLSQGYIRTEGKHTVDYIEDSRIMLWLTMHFVANVNPNMTFS